MNGIRRSIIAMAFLLGLPGCVRPPIPLQGDYELLTVRDAQQNRLSGPSVRWGGSVVTVTPHADQTCFEIVSHPLDAAARPQETDDTDGRFIACISGFYDPAVYEAGREVTVVGTIADGIDGKIGERAYRFPRVDAAHVYLWPKREPTIMYGPVYDPFWHPFWWGPIYPRHRNY